MYYIKYSFFDLSKRYELFIEKLPTTGNDENDKYVLSCQLYFKGILNSDRKPIRTGFVVSKDGHRPYQFNKLASMSFLAGQYHEIEERDELIQHIEQFINRSIDKIIPYIDNMPFIIDVMTDEDLSRYSEDDFITYED